MRPLRPSMIRLALLCAPFVTGCGACDARATQEGERGELLFWFLPADGDDEFDRPLARGSTLVVHVEDLDDDPVERIEALEASNPAVLDVRRDVTRTDRFVITGAGVGTSKVEVDAIVAGGDSRRDRVGFEVREPRRASLGHRCATGSDAAYIVGEPMLFDFARFDDRGRRLVGRGACGVSLSDPAIMPGVGCDSASLTLTGVEQTGPLQLLTGLEPNRSGRARLGVQVVDPRLIDFDASPDPLYDGRVTHIELFAKTPDWPICTAIPFDVVILTPASCALSGGGLASSFEASDRMIVSLRGDRPGSCVLEITLPRFGLPDVWEFHLPVLDDGD